METNSLEWVELEHLTSHLKDLHMRLQAVRAMKHLGAIKAVEREIAVTAPQRDRLLRALRSRLADQVTASLASQHDDPTVPSAQADRKQQRFGTA
jgi:hypothetical protein